MKLLICTQAVDENDSDLGFFVAWIREFAAKCESVLVITLREGKHSLPVNVEIYTLGTGRIRRAVELLHIAFMRRASYQAVFVHMNPEYVVVSGWLWKLLGKKIALWYTHKSVDFKLRAATLFTDMILTASKESFRLPGSKPVVVGHGIDTDFFTPDTAVQRGTHILSAGRLSKTKNHDLIIRAAQKAGRELRIAGEGPERAELETLAQEGGAQVEFLGGLTQLELRDQYRMAAHFVHASSTGSMDKVVLEAAACDCNVITTVPDLYKDFPVQSAVATPEAIAAEILRSTRESADRVSIIRNKHSLSVCIEKILWNIQN
ncbi:MAG: glycosyltransferase family 4 protein [Minisyncoccia bacterium]